MSYTKLIFIVIITAVFLFSLSLGYALGGGSLNVFSPTYSVEAEYEGDAPQIIVNGRSNRASVQLVPVEQRPVSMVIGTWAFLASVVIVLIGCVKWIVNLGFS